MIKAVKKHFALKGSLGIILGVILGWFFLPIFFELALRSLGTDDVVETAPSGSFEIRRSWGEEKLGVYFASAEAFVRRNGKIEADIGKVIGVAPIRGPNKHGTSFHGESETHLKLQVIGEEGEGVLWLTEYDWGGRSGQAKWEQTHWAHW